MLIIVVFLAIFQLSLGNVVEEAAWPLPDATDPGVLMAHGLHCKETLEQLQDETDLTEMNIMHKNHCSTLMIKVKGFLVDNLDYNPPAVNCQDMKRLRSKRDSFCYQACFNYLVTSFCYQWCNGRKKRGTTDNNFPSKQKEFYAQMGKNFGELLMKKWKGMPLNHGEFTALQAWEKEEVVHFAAFSILCEYDRNGHSAADVVSDLNNLIA